MGFLGRRMGKHLSEVDAVQKEFKSFQTLGAISQALALATSVTLISAVFSDAVDEVTGEELGWFQVYQWPIYCGVGYLATGLHRQQQTHQNSGAPQWAHRGRYPPHLH